MSLPQTSQNPCHTLAREEKGGHGWLGGAWRSTAARAHSMRFLQYLLRASALMLLSAGAFIMSGPSFRYDALCLSPLS